MSIRLDNVTKSCHFQSAHLLQHSVHYLTTRFVNPTKRRMNSKSCKKLAAHLFAWNVHGPGGKSLTFSTKLHPLPSTHVYACLLSCVWLLVTLWTVAHQAPLSTGFSMQEYQSGLPFPSPGDLPNPGIEPASPVSPALGGDFSTTEPPGKPPKYTCMYTNTFCSTELMPIGHTWCTGFFFPASQT